MTNAALGRLMGIDSPEYSQADLRTTLTVLQDLHQSTKLTGPDWQEVRNVIGLIALRLRLGT